MVQDYSERRQIRKIQPKARPAVWPYILLLLLLVLSSFAIGVGTGWYLYRPGGKFYKAPAAAAATQPKPGGNLPPQGDPLQPLQQNAATPRGEQSDQSAPAGQEKGAAPPLTFYKTLQKGNKELMGTGINNPKEGQGTGQKPASPP